MRSSFAAALLASAGLASAGLASAGLASAGLASAGLASAGLASDVRPDPSAPPTSGTEPSSPQSSPPASPRVVDDPIARGAYLFRAGGCVNCHTDTEHGGPELAGGVEIRTAFGTFYGSNITPDPGFGIGSWSEADFLRAMREGVGPGGQRYFPVFPYTSFTRMTDADLRDLWAYLRTVPASVRPSRSHQVKLLYRPTLLRRLWRALNFSPGPYQPDPAHTPEWNRGAYLVLGPTHCGECHTPRGSTGGVDNKRLMAGSPDGAELHPVPNITPDRETGIGEWQVGDLAEFLKSGLTPDGDVTGGLMADVVNHGTSHFSDQDRQAMAVYLASLPPVHHPIGEPGKRGAKPEW